MSEKKQTADQFFQACCLRKPWQWDRANAVMSESEVDQYGDMRAEEARAEERDKVLAEPRSQKAEAYTRKDDSGLIRAICEKECWHPTCNMMRETIAIAKQEGVDEAKAELLKKWRATDVEEWLYERDYTNETIVEALAMARAQGPEEKP